MFSDTIKRPYRAIIKEEWKNLEEELKDKTNIVFPLTTTKDTAVHLAVYSGGEEPVRGLLAAISAAEYRPVFWRNSAGNTPLHEAATVGNLAAVKLLVEYNKEDVLAENINGETPLFRAARCGHLHIVDFFLDGCDDFYSRSYAHWTGRKDQPILHAAVQSEKFEVVVRLVEFEKSLLELKDIDNKTALHVLANMPHAFKTGFSITVFQSIIYSLLPSEDIYKQNYSNFWSSNNNGSESSSTIKNKKNEDLEAGLNSNPQLHICHSNIWARLLQCLTFLFWRFIFLGWPQWKEMYQKKLQHNLALTITKMLAQIDYSWQQTQAPPENNDVDPTGIKGEPVDISNIETPLPDPNDDKQIADIKYYDHHETPLLLAAANGIIEIIDEIVEAHPQAVDYVTSNNRNVLHIAIAHRQSNVFEWIQNHRLIMARLVRRIDALGFTALHHVGITKFYRGGTHGPALQLQQELKWYNRVQAHIPALYTMHHSTMKWTARELFDRTHAKMLDDGKEWLKKTSESCSAVAVLIATVVFAAAYTVPGGLDSRTGSPILLTQPVYIVFTVMDIVALATALTSVVMFLSILTSSFKMDAFLHTLPLKLSIGFQLLFFSVATTMMAFALTIVLTVKKEEMKWTVSLLYTATFFPVTMFIIIQLPLYVELVKNIWSTYLDIISSFLPMGFVSLFWKIPSKIFTS